MSNSYDVIIAGGGPVGLFLACELAMRDVSVVVLERDTETDSTSWKHGQLGYRGLNVTAIEAFYRRGLMGQLFNDGKRPPQFERGPMGGHFAGMILDGNKIDFSRWKYYLHGPSAFPGANFQGHMEAILSERAKTLGVQILRGTPISRLADEGEIVKVWAGDQVFTAPWLVGCDGGRSLVRKAGFDFVGTDAEFVCYVTECELDRPELLTRGFMPTKKGMYIKMSDNHVYVVDFDTTIDRSQTVTKEQFQEVLRRVTETDITVIAIRMASTTTDRSKQVTQYKLGRVLLAGDSAHIHSPLGAQGLNAGYGDAMNLGWKLAATIKGSAPPGLLDTYHEERHPVAARVLEWTRAQVTILRPDSHGAAMKDIIRALLNTDDGVNYFVDRFWGLSQRYDLGDAHPLVGCSAPDFEFDDGRRLGLKLEQGQFLIVDFTSDPSVADFAQSLVPKVQYLGSSAKETFGMKVLLVRPDGVVAWVTEDEVQLDTMKTALSRWLQLS